MKWVSTGDGGEVLSLGGDADALALTAETLSAAGGYPDFPILEEYELVQRLHDQAEYLHFELKCVGGNAAVVVAAHICCCMRSRTAAASAASAAAAFNASL